MGISASEKKPIPENLVQEVESGVEGQRVLIIHSQERQSYEEAIRQRCMDKTRVRLEKLQTRNAEEKIKVPNKMNAAAQRILDKNYGSRYYRFGWRGGQFFTKKTKKRSAEEKRIEGKYVMITTEKNLDIVEAVEQYNELMEVERGFRSLKDVLQMRPIYHRTEPRVRAHIFVAALALLVERACPTSTGRDGYYHCPSSQRQCASGSTVVTNGFFYRIRQAKSLRVCQTWVSDSNLEKNFLQLYLDRAWYKSFSRSNGLLIFVFGRR